MIIINGRFKTIPMRIIIKTILMLDGLVYCQLLNGLADIFIDCGVYTPRFNFRISSDS